MCRKNIEGTIITSCCIRWISFAKKEDIECDINVTFVFVVACKKEENKKGNKNIREP